MVHGLCLSSRCVACRGHSIAALPARGQQHTFSSIIMAERDCNYIKYVKASVGACEPFIFCIFAHFADFTASKATHQALSSPSNQSPTQDGSRNWFNNCKYHERGRYHAYPKARFGGRHRRVTGMDTIQQRKVVESGTRGGHQASEERNTKFLEQH